MLSVFYQILRTFPAYIFECAQTRSHRIQALHVTSCRIAVIIEFYFSGACTVALLAKHRKWHKYVATGQHFT